MSDQQYPDLVQAVGVVGREPEQRVTASGKSLVKFSLARPKNYDRGENSTEWLEVAVFNEDLQAKVLDEVYKGAKVAVEGNLKLREYEGKTFRDFVALRVGLVAWIAKSGSAQAKPKPADDDGLGF